MKELVLRQLTRVQHHYLEPHADRQAGKAGASEEKRVMSEGEDGPEKEQTAGEKYFY